MARDALRSQVTFAMVPTWVLQRCSSNAVHIYGFLMTYTNGRDRERKAWPKLPVLAEEAGKSLRTVERAITELRRAGALQTRRRHARSGAVVGLEFVLIQVDPTGDLALVEPDRPGAPLPATRGGKAGSNHPATIGGMAPDHPANSGGTIPPPVAGLKREQDPREQDPRAESPAPAALARGGHPVVGGIALDPAQPEEAFLLAWNAARQEPVKAVTVLTPRRRRLIRARLAERPLDAWRAVIDRIVGSSFCLGAKGWVASLDWLIATPDAGVKALEGLYDDHLGDAELEAARAHQARMGGCPHEPRCADWRLCVRELALRLRAHRSIAV